MQRVLLPLALLMSLALLLAGCLSAQEPAAETTPYTPKGGTMQVTSSAFGEGQMIPTRYTCDGENISPPLAWTGVPAQAKALVLIVDDPEAPGGTWVHWIVMDLPAGLTGLPEAVRSNQSPGPGATQGTTSYRAQGYGGPCPPGGTHRYYFKLYALDAPLALTGKATANDALAAMKGHVLASAELMGRYKRK